MEINKYIINPNNGNKYLITNRKGIQILKNYIKYYNSYKNKEGGSESKYPTEEVDEKKEESSTPAESAPATAGIDTESSFIDTNDDFGRLPGELTREEMFQQMYADMPTDEEEWGDDEWVDERGDATQPVLPITPYYNPQRSPTNNLTPPLPPRISQRKQRDTPSLLLMGNPTPQAPGLVRRC